MQEIFRKRRQEFLLRCLKYSRYVMNDHFVLVLLVFIGFLSLQYRELLLHFPENPWGVYVLLAGITVLLFFAGQTATYLEAADQQFLLVKEKEVTSWVQAARNRQFLIWASVQLLGQVLLLPLYEKLGLPFIGFVLFVLVLTLSKKMLLQGQANKFVSNGSLDWAGLIQAEEKRKQGILQFFALFTKVKGITTSVKRRAYLDGLLPRVRHQRGTWNYLYARAFLRSGDFLGLSIRLTVLSTICLISIQLSWLAIGLAFLFQYLLLFQLLALFSVYDYQSMARLYPLSLSAKIKSFQTVLKNVLYVISGLHSIIGLFFVTEKFYVIGLPFFTIFLCEIYLPIKAKKLID
ncbi:ABC transporter permease [Streptococcus cameli]